ncbi:MAG: SpoIIE family protein phosphatase [Armatimonadota bacterium]|nr:SpoIIE family protein phosphatase [Armatimonadota bacterium]
MPTSSSSNGRPRQASSPRGKLLAAVIGLLLLGVFVADLRSAEDLHVGILFNVIIALTVWSRRPAWVVATTALSVLLRLVAHLLDPGTRGGESYVPLFNLVVGIVVQMLTGSLIWRQVRVQQRESRLLAAERKVRSQAQAAEGEAQEHSRALAHALREAERATAKAQESTRQERAAREREHQTLASLERVKDLSLALNRAVLPDIPPAIAAGRIRLGAHYSPAEHDIQIGGDFYDVLALDDAQTRYALVIGDVAGHGVEAAAQTALVTSTLRAFAREIEDGPAAILSRTARALEGQLASFVSLFLGIYDATAGTITYANAGHEPPILIHTQTADFPEPLSPTGPILGVGGADAEEAQAAFGPGDVLVLLTDGLTEARRADGEMIAWDGVAALAAQRAARLPPDDVQGLVEGLLQDVRVWATGRPLTDDIALLIARRIALTP